MKPHIATLPHTTLSRTTNTARLPSQPTNLHDHEHMNHVHARVHQVRSAAAAALTGNQEAPLGPPLLHAPPHHHAHHGRVHDHDHDQNRTLVKLRRHQSVDPSSDIINELNKL